MRKVKNRRNGLMKSKSFFVMIMAIALILSGITIFFGCTDKEEFPKTEAIDGLKEITEKGALTEKKLRICPRISMPKR